MSGEVDEPTKIASKVLRSTKHLLLVSRFRHLNIVDCLLRKKGFKVAGWGEGHGHPIPPLRIKLISGIMKT